MNRGKEPLIFTWDSNIVNSFALEKIKESLVRQFKDSDFFPILVPEGVDMLTELESWEEEIEDEGECTNCGGCTDCTDDEKTPCDSIGICCDCGVCDDILEEIENYDVVQYPYPCDYEDDHECNDCGACHE